MRQVAFTVSVVLCAAMISPAFSPAFGQARYTAGNPPGQQASQQAAPEAASQTSAAPQRYSVQSDGPQPAAASAPQAAPTAQIQSAPLPPQAAPVLRGQDRVIESHPVYSAGDPPPPPAPPPALRPAEPVETVVVQATGRGYVLGPSDKVHVTVYGEADLTGDFEISMAGRIAFPLIGDVQAAGLTAPQLGERIGAKLAAGYLLSPRVAVEVTNYRPFFVLGQVTKPGSFPFASGMTISRAIALAGGYTPQAIEDTVYVRHEGETKERKVPADSTLEVEPGDVVRIDISTFWEVVDAFVPLATIVGVIRSGVP